MQNKTVNTFPVTWEQVHRDALRLANKLKEIQNVKTENKNCHSKCLSLKRQNEIIKLSTLLLITKGSQDWNSSRSGIRS